MKLERGGIVWFGSSHATADNILRAIVQDFHSGF